MRILKHHFPICFISDESICTYRSGCFYLVNLLDGSISYLASLKISLIERALSRINYLSRLFRTGVRYGKLISTNQLLFVHNKKIYSFNILTKKMSVEHYLNKGSRPLSITKIQDLEGFKNGLYFGEYFYNPGKTEVKIFRRDDNSKWYAVGSFPEGTVNHIHNLIQDPFRRLVWILSGDVGESAGIWYSKNGFKNIEPVLLGSQEYRACIAFPTEKGLLYATDSPMNQNSIRLLTYYNNKWISETIAELDGPVIYGCKVKNNFVFSTSVERNVTGTGLEMLIGIGRRKGINGPICSIYQGNLKEGFKKVYSDKKDFLPDIFQFGVFLFPEGNNSTNILPFYPIALKKNDLSLHTLKINVK